MKAQVKENNFVWYLWLVGYVITGLFVLYVISNLATYKKDDSAFEQKMKTIAAEHKCEYLGQVKGAERVTLFNCDGKVLAELLDEKK